MRGAGFMAISMIAFTVNDAFMKLLGGTIPLPQALFLRGLGTVVFLAILAWLMGQLRFDHSRRDWTLIGVRTAAEVATTFFFLTALLHLPIANVSAVMQALPLTVSLAGAVFLGEALGWRRLVAILIGFVGVYLIIMPGAEGFSIYSLYVVAAVCCVTLRDIVVRKMSSDVPSLMIGLVAATGVMLAGATITVTRPWVPVDPQTAFYLAGSMGAIIFGYIFSVVAMRVGEIGFVAPFRYTSLVVALILGWFVFGDWPTLLALIGASIVVATGLFTLYRERRLRLQRPSSPRLR